MKSRCMSTSIQVIRLWDFNTGRLLNEVMGHSSNITSIKFSHDNRTLISTATDGTVAIWKLHHAGDAANGEQPN